MARHLAPDRMSEPYHPFFAGLGGALFIAALFTDTMYASTALMQWANFSAWLITGGLLLAFVAALVLIVDLTILKTGPLRWFDFSLLATAALLSIVNMLVHTRDAWTSVVPSGVALSGVIALLLVIAGLRGWCVTRTIMLSRGEAA